MSSELQFSLETIDGDRVGKLVVPFPKLADWLNLLTSPHYKIQILHTEQSCQTITLYFDAFEAMYWYINDRVQAESRFAMPAMMSLAS